MTLPMLLTTVLYILGFSLDIFNLTPLAVVSFFYHSMCLCTRLCPDAQRALVLCQCRFLEDEGDESAFNVRTA